MNDNTRIAIDTGFRPALRRMQAAGRFRTYPKVANPEFEIAGMM